MHSAACLQSDQAVHRRRQQLGERRVWWIRQCLRHLALLDDHDKLAKGREGSPLQLALLRGNRRVTEEKSIACRMFDAEVDHDLERVQQFRGRFCLRARWIDLITDSCVRPGCSSRKTRCRREVKFALCLADTGSICREIDLALPGCPGAQAGRVDGPQDEGPGERLAFGRVDVVVRHPLAAQAVVGGQFAAGEKGRAVRPGLRAAHQRPVRRQQRQPPRHGRR